MKRVLLSINPEHVSNIISGRKKYEYRKIVAKQEVSSIYIYETTPVKRIVAEAEVLGVIKLPPNQLWELTKQYSGISKCFFDTYFQDRQVAYAYELGKVTVYEKPRKLIDFGVKAAPQSFVYI
ncbi:MAG: ASCH domain-containing protein [Clostridiales bacterium]|nr:ASCH domain-containing protein [Clostridiales bacterium]